MEPSRRNRVLAVCAIVFMACLRIAHSGILWADEDYHLAAAVHMLHGKLPYRDFWYDKPPLSALYYLLVGGHSGLALRLLDSAYILLACYLAYLLAKRLWSETEGWVAALLLAFFTTFYLPSAVIPFTPDALMIAPHLAAIYFAVSRKALPAGFAAGVAFLVNTKAIFVLASCAVFLFSPVLIGGFLIPLAGGASWAVATGAWAGYREQVWEWGLVYAREFPALNPVKLGFTRTVNWLGFHSALVMGTVFGLQKQWRLAAWMAISFAAVYVGFRFEPRYYLQLLPPLVIVASRGILFVFERYRIGALALGICLLIPFIRFGPAYFTRSFGSDIAMDQDSQAASAEVLALAKPGDTLFVWGYRPNVYVYTHMTSDSRFWDSQPISGVPADRHLTAESAIYSGPAVRNRAELVHSHPTFIVDGLSPLNPKLAPQTFPDLRDWLADYQVVARTKLSIIYRRATSDSIRRPPQSAAP